MSFYLIYKSTVKNDLEMCGISDKKKYVDGYMKYRDNNLFRYTEVDEDTYTEHLYDRRDLKLKNVFYTTKDTSKDNMDYVDIEIISTDDELDRLNMIYDNVGYQFNLEENIFPISIFSNSLRDSLFTLHYSSFDTNNYHDVPDDTYIELDKISVIIASSIGNIDFY